MGIWECLRTELKQRGHIPLTPPGCNALWVFLFARTQCLPWDIKAATRNKLEPLQIPKSLLLFGLLWFDGVTITGRFTGCRYLLTIIPGRPRQVQITFPLWSSEWKVLYTVFTSAWWKRSCGTQSWRAEGRETTWLGWGSDRKAGICGRQGANTDVIASSLESRDSPPRLWSTGWQHCHSSFPCQPMTEGHQRVRMMKILPYGSNCDDVVYRVTVQKCHRVVIVVNKYRRWNRAGLLVFLLYRLLSGRVTVELAWKTDFTSSSVDDQRTPSAIFLSLLLIFNLVKKNANLIQKKI